MSAQIIPFPASPYLPHWTDADAYLFDHHRRNGLGIEQASEAVEGMRHVMRVIPDEADPSLRQAREAFALMARMQR